jgi:hypothetical protein
MAHVTTPSRVALAAVTAWLMPSLSLACLVMVGDAFTSRGPDADMISAGATALIAGPVMGLLLGWPYLLAALIAWALVHHWGLVSAKVAVGVGLLCGVAAGIALWGHPAGGQDIQGLFLAPVIGAATGFCVWQIAYGEQRARLADPGHA